ncbi:MAG: hypothetical protein ABIH46_07930 [Chloroflexota bacterium]
MVDLEAPDEVGSAVERFWVLIQELRRRPYGEFVVTMRSGRPVGLREMGHKIELSIAPREPGPTRPEG